MDETADNKRKNTIYRVTIVGTVVNVLLTLAKLLAGIVGRSGAMIADAVHSLSDFATDIIVLLFVRLSLKPSDCDHKYGHGKYETLASVIISVILIGVGVGIGYENGVKIWDFYHGVVIPQPHYIALVAAAVSIVAKEALYWYTVRAAKRISSSVLEANAWHHRSDALSSIAALIGIGGAILLGENWIVLDPIAALLVSVLIIVTGFKLLKPGVDELLERSLPSSVENEIMELLNNFPQTQDPHKLKTRKIGSSIAIEFHIRVEGETKVSDAHDILCRLEAAIREKFGENAQIITHIEPIK